MSEQQIGNRLDSSHVHWCECGAPLGFVTKGDLGHPPIPVLRRDRDEMNTSSRDEQSLMSIPDSKDAIHEIFHSGQQQLSLRIF